MKRQDDRRARGRSRFAPALDDSDSYFDSIRHNKPDHKTAQLCRQVMRTLTMALADCADDAIRDLTVMEVTPAPDATRLLVTVLARREEKTGLGGIFPIPGMFGNTDGKDRMDAETGTGAVSCPGIVGRLLAATPHLRREIASAITRKRVPELMFQIVHEEEGQA